MTARNRHTSYGKKRLYGTVMKSKTHSPTNRKRHPAHHKKRLPSAPTKSRKVYPKKRLYSTALSSYAKLYKRPAERRPSIKRRKTPQRRRK